MKLTGERIRIHPGDRTAPCLWMATESVLAKSAKNHLHKAVANASFIVWAMRIDNHVYLELRSRN